MRGRGRSGGQADLSGWELQDWIDGVEFVRREYGEYLSDPNCVYAEGGSGAGGNVYAIVGKFPDFFSAAVVHSGMSDYLAQYQLDETGEFRDEPEHRGWIGGTPATNPEGYRSRGGLTTVKNLLTPLHVDHGETDIRVSVDHARRYVETARRLGRQVEYLEWPSVGDREHWTHMTAEQQQRLQAAIRAFYTAHQKPPRLPETGTFVVAGYLKTRVFEVVLPDIDRIGELAFDVHPGRPWQFVLRAATSRRAVLRFRWRPEATPRIVAGDRNLSGRRVQGGEWLEVALDLPDGAATVAIE
jgi:hypothetical protein